MSTPTPPPYVQPPPAREALALAGADNALADGHGGLTQPLISQIVEALPCGPTGKIVPKLRGGDGGGIGEFVAGERPAVAHSPSCDAP